MTPEGSNVGRKKAIQFFDPGGVVYELHRAVAIILLMIIFQLGTTNHMQPLWGWDQLHFVFLPTWDPSGVGVVNIGQFENKGNKSAS